MPPELAAVDEPAEATAGDGDVESTAEPAAGVAEMKNDGGAANEEDAVDESSDDVRAGAPVEPQAEDDDVEVVTERAAPEETEDLPSDAADEPPAASLDGEELDGADGDGQPQIAKRTVGSTEPAPISVNGKGVRPEDDA